jgi:hypothetical protein
MTFKLRTDRGAFMHFRVLLCALAVLCGFTRADEPFRSGLQPGQRPGPYSALIATGPERGQSCCYVCETGDHPAVVIFARSLSNSLGQLAHGLDEVAADQQGARMRAWITFLNEDQSRFDPKVVRWGQEHAIKNLPLGVFEDASGPPSYRLAADADVTVLLFARRQIVANFAFRNGELKPRDIAEILRASQGMVK